jgi:hypothetical protein
MARSKAPIDVRFKPVPAAGPPGARQGLVARVKALEPDTHYVPAAGRPNGAPRHRTMPL